MNGFKRPGWNFLRPALAALFVFASAGSAAAEHQSCECDESICNGQGFEVTLQTYVKDQLNGTSTWTYKVCNDEGNDGGTCVPPKDLSHIDFVLPGLSECLTANQSVSIAQVSNPAGDAATLNCSVSDKDPSCDVICAEGTGGDTGIPCEEVTCAPGTGGPGIPCLPPTDPEVRVLKCNVSDDTNLDAGECVTIALTITGEVPLLGPGVTQAVSKAGKDCVSNSICGPACGCEQALQGCLTRTAGFWGTHPAVTALFLPVTVNGNELSTTDADACDSATEALCVSPGAEGTRKSCDANPQYMQLVRQLTAAKLNLAATAANAGSCGSDIESLITSCEGMCSKNTARISLSNCIEQLDAFNNSQDTFAITPAPFDNPGPADPSQCQLATGNNVVVGKSCGGLNCQ